ncbi:MAG: hypothetical protein ACFFDK_00105 [Promethearchaeota archaeon]
MAESKFLTDSRNLNIAIIIILITSIFLIISGAIYAILGTFMPYHVEYTGLTESEVAAYSPKLMFLISVFIRLLGISVMIIGISSIYITVYGIRKKEKWAWTGYTIASSIYIIPNFILTLLVTGFLGFPFLSSLIGGIFTIIALWLSYKEIF